MNSRRYPRTLQEAFGPYTSRSISEPYAPMHRSDKIVVAGCVVAALVLAVLMVVGVV